MLGADRTGSRKVTEPNVVALEIVGVGEGEDEDVAEVVGLCLKCLQKTDNAVPGIKRKATNRRLTCSIGCGSPVILDLQKGWTSLSSCAS